MINTHYGNGGDGAVQATAGVIYAGDRSIGRGNIFIASHVDGITGAE